MERMYKNQRFYFIFVYPSLIFLYYWPPNAHANQLYLQRPQTEKERLELKQDWSNISLQRNYPIDKYDNDIKPYYDTHERRRKYPEHYGDKYENVKFIKTPIC